jgi:hypothetical protein
MMPTRQHAKAAARKPGARIDLVPALLPSGELLHTTRKEAAVLNLELLQRLIAGLVGKAFRALLIRPQPMPPTAILAGLAAAVEQHRPTRR